MRLRYAATALFVPVLAAQSWVTQTSNTTASLRGLSVVDDKTVWASGAGGTFLRTSDAGATWILAKVPGAEKLDFRDVEAFSAVVYLMSAGPGDASRLYKTTDNGANWTLQFSNPDETGFWDAIAFWDGDHGILLGDPVGGRFTIFTTANGGKTWARQKGPSARPKEGAFAASGTCLIAGAKGEAWFASGGPEGARVFHSTDSGATWTAVATPVRNDAASSGIFSLAFADSQRGIAVGGEYTKPADTQANAAMTIDGGRTWSAIGVAPPAGYRSAIAYSAERKLWIATGTSGSDYSADGVNWKTFDHSAYNAVAFSHGAGWAVGPDGRVARLDPKPAELARGVYRAAGQLRAY